jgi:DNA-binding MarR family transcriptional regulator
MESEDPTPNEDRHERPTYELFLNQTPAKILAALKNPQIDNYGRPISRAIDSTYSHTLKTISRLEEHGILETEIDGRKKTIMLTEKGEELAEHTEKLLDSFETKPVANPRNRWNPPELRS